jgi:hypothetical protein
MIHDRTGVKPEEQVLVWGTKPFGYSEETLKLTAEEYGL